MGKNEIGDLRGKKSKAEEVKTARMQKQVGTETAEVSCDYGVDS